MHSVLRNVPVLVALIVLGLVAAAFPAQVASKVGTPQEIGQRIVRLRHFGLVLMAASAGLLILRAIGWWR